jgi:hypothetical protein
MHKTRTLCYYSPRVPTTSRVPSPHVSLVGPLASPSRAPALRGVLVLAAVAAVFAPPRAARADGDDRTVAQALIASGAALGPAAVTGAAVAAANDALERGTRLRVAGDEVHARVADGLAREWAETARDLAAAAAAEKMAEDRKRQAIQAHAQLQRTKALVEEGLARLGRLRAELDAASGPLKHAPSAASTKPAGAPTPTTGKPGAQP